jgi:hypothetical protein
MIYELDIDVIGIKFPLIIELGKDKSKIEKSLLEYEEKIRGIKQVDIRNRTFDRSPAPMIEGQSDRITFWWEIYTKAGFQPEQTHEEIKKILG